MRRWPFALALLIAQPASAYVRETTADGLHYLQWAPTSFPIAWTLQSDPPNSAMNDAIVMQQFQQWQSVTCAQLSVATTPGSIAGAQATVAEDGVSEIFWQTNWTYGSAVLGLTTPWYDTATGVISEADTQFNAEDWTWQPPGAYEACVQSEYGCADTASIALHEEGHFLGMAHSHDTAAVMVAVWDGAPRRTLSSDDIAGICDIYPGNVPGGGIQDQPCGATSDCSAGLSCAAVTGTTSDVCSASCAGAGTSCPLGDSCQASTDSAWGCFVAPTGGTQGNACSTSSPCEYGYDCVAITSTLLCYQDCDPTTPTCASGLDCNAWPSTITAPPNSLGGYCNGAASPSGAAACAVCNDASPCDPGLDCVPLNDGSGNAVCRAQCSSSDACADGSVCLPAADFMDAPAVCSCASDTGAEGGPCNSNGSCSVGESCVDDGTASQPLCRVTCGGVSCRPGYSCRDIAGVSACVPGAPTADAGTTSAKPTGHGCQSSSSTFAGLIVFAYWSRRRRALSPGCARRR